MKFESVVLHWVCLGRSGKNGYEARPGCTEMVTSKRAGKGSKTAFYRVWVLGQRGAVHGFHDSPALFVLRRLEKKRGYGVCAIRHNGPCSWNALA